MHVPHRTRRALTGFAALFLLLAIAFLAAVPAGGRTEANSVSRQIAGGNHIEIGRFVDMERAMSGDLVALGRTLSIGGTVGDTLAAFGRSVTLRGKVEHDAVVAAASLDVPGSIGDSAYLAAGDLTLSGAVAGNLVAVAGQATLNPGSQVQGDAIVTGGDVALRGFVAGDVEVRAQTLVVGPTGRIGGRLVVWSPEPPTLSAGASVRGGVEHHRIEEPRTRGWLALDLLASLLVLAGSLWALALIILAAAKPGALTAGRALARKPLISTSIGIVGIVAGVPLIALLAFTVIGIPAAVAGLGVYIASLAGSVPMFALAAASRVAPKPGADRPAEPSNLGLVAGSAAVIVLIVAAGLVPYVGWCIWVLAASAGVGCTVVAAFDWRHGARPPVPLS